MHDEIKRLRDALREIKSGNCPTPYPMTDEGLLAYHKKLATEALIPRMREFRAYAGVHVWVGEENVMLTSGNSAVLRGSRLEHLTQEA